MNKRAFTIFYIVILIFVTACGAPEKETGETAVAEEEPSNDISEKDHEDTDEIEEPQEDRGEQEKDMGETTDKESEETSANLGDYEVQIGGEMVEMDDKIAIHGESNLLPGARVVGEVIVGDEDEREFFADTTELVEEDGTFYMEIAHHDLEEETDVTVKFHFDGQQNDDITRHYGDRGQQLEGPYIYKHQGEVGGGKPQNIFKQAKVTTTFEPGEEKAVRQFKEPNWHPIPEDMGDTRVWIEVDEINNDKEYFYLQGRSNLVEGSSIYVKYRHRMDETRVLPDGSFHFKFPYEYREDTPFEITFEPNRFDQWNEVVEVYGEKGQKLVGELVVQDKFSDKQFVQKVIEQESSEIDVPDNVELSIEGSEVTMLVPDHVLFDFDKYDLKDESKKILTEISETLDTSFNKKDFEIMINGHTDNVGNKDYNMELSEKRAESVKDFLQGELETSEATFTTNGYGDTKPIASNDTENGQAKNRRVEIVIHLK